jgi:hypothetical protein
MQRPKVIEGVFNQKDTSFRFDILRKPSERHKRISRVGNAAGELFRFSTL